MSFQGEIAAVGDSIKQFAVGDLVMGAAGFPNNPCCYSEYISTSADSIVLKNRQI